MIERIKNKQLQDTALLVILGGLLVTSSASFATNDLVADAAMSGTDAGSSIPTTVGSTVVAPVSSAEPVAAAPVDNAKTKSPSTTAKILDAISKHPNGRDAKMPEWRAEQEQAVTAARAGNYDVALPILERLHNEHPEELGIATDRAAILAWAGHDADAVAAYKALAAGARPDYLIDAIGHSYRNLHQPNDALDVYRLGLQTYPDNQSFLAGEIFSLLESDHVDQALTLAQQDDTKYPNAVAPLGQAIETANRANAVNLARTGHLKESLAAFTVIHAKYPADNGITGDYVVALSWAGHDSDAVAMYKTLPADAQEDYVLDAAAHSYRNLHQSKHALELYQAALDKTPDNVTYAVGVIYSLADLGRSKEALEVAKAQLQKHPEKPEALVKAYTYVERHRAIDMARAGHYKEALALLRQLRAKYPSDVTETMDYIAVSSWAGHDKDAVTEYEKIARQPMPDYVLEAVGHSYRNLHQSEKALAIYRRGSKQSPRNATFAAGEIRCLDDLGRYDEGVERAKGYTEKYGHRLEVLLAGGEAANFDEQPVEALNFYQHADHIAPKNHEALRGVIHAEDKVGAPQLALRDAAKHPGLLNGKEYRALVGDRDTAMVRWGTLEPISEATRYDETDAALATLDKHIGEWTAKNDPSYYPNIQRARFDRLVALRDRARMQDVVDSYNTMVQEGIEIPAYALEAVGDAYLYLREPEIARDIFLKVLETEPNNFEARRLLAYAYLECEQYDQSYAAIDKLRDDEPVWLYLKGEPERQPNPDRAVADLDAGDLRAYGDMLQDADDRLTPVVSAAPFNAKNRNAEGNLYMMRGWPRQALENFQIGKAIQNGHDVDNETGIAMANLDLQNFKETEAGINSLVARFPENAGVQRAARLWDVHNMAELDAHAGYNFAPTENKTLTNAPHGQGFDVGAELYSMPIEYNWRLFAGEDWAHEHEPNAEGIVDYSRSNAGVEYRNGDVTVSAAPTFNRFVSTTTSGGERVGADGTFKYTFNDVWSAGIAAQLFSASTPLRALDAGVTSDEYGVNGLWRQSEARSLAMAAYAMPFSDGNFRTGQDAEYIERLSTNPIYKLDAEGNLASTQDNKNENRLYFNPSLDLTGMAGLRATQSLYRRYETQYEHSLLGMAGFYAQQHYGTTPAWTVRYEQRIHYNDTLNAGAGVNYTHQDYDGLSQDAVSVTMDIVERF